MSGAHNCSDNSDLLKMSTKYIFDMFAYCVSKLFFYDLRTIIYPAFGQSGYLEHAGIQTKQPPAVNGVETSLWCVHSLSKRLSKRVFSGFS